MLYYQRFLQVVDSKVANQDSLLPISANFSGPHYRPILRMANSMETVLGGHTCWLSVTKRLWQHWDSLGAVLLSPGPHDSGLLPKWLGFLSSELDSSSLSLFSVCYSSTGDYLGMYYSHVLSLTAEST